MNKSVIGTILGSLLISLGKRKTGSSGISAKSIIDQAAGGKISVFATFEYEPAIINHQVMENLGNFIAESVRIQQELIEFATRFEDLTDFEDGLPESVKDVIDLTSSSHYFDDALFLQRIKFFSSRIPIGFAIVSKQQDYEGDISYVKEWMKYYSEPFKMTVRFDFSTEGNWTTGSRLFKDSIQQTIYFALGLSESHFLLNQDKKLIMSKADWHELPTYVFEPEESNFPLIKLVTKITRKNLKYIRTF